ncbi:MAG: class I SAM-dependent methyltransferase [Bacteroidetes bacterium]|nr:class I SAM-dependent methyltransferase [Bacteroidota bacterium]
MQYDPIKRSLGKVFNKTPFLRRLFYKLLDILLLRSWHVRKELRHWAQLKAGPGKVNILDAGSGFGQYTYFMSGLRLNNSILAVDVKDEQIADCNAFFSSIGRKGVLFEKADLTAFTKQAYFDLILSVDVMEHIAEDEKVFSNFYDSLTQDGILLISTPSDKGGSDVHDHDHGESFIDEHVRDGYNIDNISAKLMKAGFTRSEARYTYGTPGQLGWKLSMKYPILMLNASRLLFVVLPFYYLITFPFALLFNYIDLHTKHESGTGLLVKAWK